MADWYFAREGKQQGPVAEARLLEMIRSGEVGGADLVWKDGMSGWEPVSKVPALAAALLAVPSGSSVPPPRPAGATPYLPPSRSPQPVQVMPVGGERVPTYLWQAIVVTLVCCLPFGIVAIVYASRVSSLLYQGDYIAAKKASDRAKLWVNISVLAGVAIGLLSFVGGLASESA